MFFCTAGVLQPVCIMHSHVVRVHVIDDTLPCQTNVLKLLKCMCSLFVFVFGLRPAHTCHMQRYGRVMHDPIESCAIMRGMHRCTQVEQVPRPPPPVAGSESQIRVRGKRICAKFGSRPIPLGKWSPRVQSLMIEAAKTFLSVAGW